MLPVLPAQDSGFWRRTTMSVDSSINARLIGLFLFICLLRARRLLRLSETLFLGFIFGYKLAMFGLAVEFAILIVDTAAEVHPNETLRLSISNILCRGWWRDFPLFATGNFFF